MKPKRAERNFKVNSTVKEKKKLGNVTIVSESFDSIRHGTRFPPVFFFGVVVVVVCVYLLLPFFRFVSLGEEAQKGEKRNPFDRRIGKDPVSCVCIP